MFAVAPLVGTMAKEDSVHLEVEHVEQAEREMMRKRERLERAE